MLHSLSQFSEAKRSAVFKAVEVEILMEAQAETAAPPKSPLRIQRLFRLPYRLIVENIYFNGCHASACVEKAKVFSGRDVGDPWGTESEKVLLQRVLRSISRISRMAVERWNVPSNHAAFFADCAGV